MAMSAEPGSQRAAVLNRLATEITEDRSALLRIIAALGIQVRSYKVFAAWAGEKAGRLKLNGYLLTRSPSVISKKQSSSGSVSKAKPPGGGRSANSPTATADSTPRFLTNSSPGRTTRRAHSKPSGPAPPNECSSATLLERATTAARPHRAVDMYSYLP